MFQNGLGTLQRYQTKILVESGAVPRSNPARTVPYVLRDKVDRELQRLQNEGILEPVEMAEWAASIVAILKRDKLSVRICGDFSFTINPVSRLDRYPIPFIFLHSLGLKEKVDALAKQNHCKIVGKWQRSIIKHLYWCVASLLVVIEKEKWFS